MTHEKVRVLKEGILIFNKRNAGYESAVLLQDADENGHKVFTVEITDLKHGDVHYIVNANLQSMIG
jgi:hypothetical protein